MHITAQMEQFSGAYLRAVAAVAGYTVSKPDVDDDSIDFSLSSGKRLASRPRIELQLKCTGRAILQDDGVHFPLPIKNYDDLRDESVTVARVLVVVLVPNQQPEDWLEHTEEALRVKHCGYWLSLRGFPDVTNSANVTVCLPRDQQFSAEGLIGIMTKLDAKEPL